MFETLTNAQVQELRSFDANVRNWIQAAAPFINNRTDALFNELCEIILSMDLPHEVIALLLNRAEHIFFLRTTCNT